jgi:glutathione S-transferase
VTAVSDFDFYYARVSGNSSRVAFFLHEAQVAFTPRLVDVPTGQNRDAAYRALNPMGKVPALVHGDLQLWESNAINWYLAELHPQARLLPVSLERRASVQRWLFFQTGHLSPACLPIFRMSSPRIQQFWRVSGDARAAATGQQELARYLPVLDQALADRQWLDGDFSLADIAYAPHLWLLADGGFDFSATPHLRDWLDRLLARPAWQSTRQMIFDD